MTTIVTTAASVTKMIDDVPKILANTVLNAVIGGTDTSKAIISESMYGISQAIGDKYYNYGASSFINGLPSGGLSQDFPSDSTVLYLQAINSEIPTANAIFVTSYRLGEPSSYMVMTEYFQDNPEWVYGHYEVTEVATGELFSFWNATHTLTNGNLHVTLSKEGIDTRVLDIPVNFNTNSQVLQVSYYRDEVDLAGPNTYNWTYVPATHKYPYLSFTTYAEGMFDYFPIAPIRLDNENVADMLEDGEPSTLTRSTRILLKRININLDEFTENLIDPEDPTAIDDLDNGYVMLAVNLNSEEDIAIKYLYEYFRQLYYIQQYDQQVWIDRRSEWPVEFLTMTALNKINIVDGMIDISITFGFITIEVKSGLIGDPQPAFDPLVLVTPPVEVVDADNDGLGDYSKSVVIGIDEVLVFAGVDDYAANSHTLTLRKQLTTGFGATFVEINVHNPCHFMSNDLGAERIYRSIGSMADGGFFIPVSKGVSGIFSSINESYLYYESLIFLAYAIEVTKLKWYQEPVFIRFLSTIFVAIGFSAGMPGLGDAIAAGIQATLIYIAETYLINVIIQEALSVLSDLVGADVALILAAIAAGIAIYQGKGEAITEFLDAETLLNYATISMKAITSNIKDDFLDLAQEQEAFLKDTEALQEEIDAADDLLSSAGEVDIYTILNSNMYTDYTESPEEFYNRSIHITNPGVMTLDVIENFTSNALALPSAQTN